MDFSVSVIIPTFNRGELCCRALHSVISQSFSPLEIIVVDDCSTDGTSRETLMIPQEWQERVHYYRLPENLGVSKARNYGIERASGDWIAFLDSDDVWHRHKLKKQCHWLSQNSRYLIAQTEEIWIRSGVRVNIPNKHKKVGGDIFLQSLQRCMITPSSVIIHSSIFKRFGQFREDFPACEDYDLWLRITAFEPVGLIEELLMTRYGGADDQLSSTVPLQDLYRVQSLLSLMKMRSSIGEEHFLAVCDVFDKKISILRSGAVRRERWEDVKIYDRYVEESNQLKSP